VREGEEEATRAQLASLHLRLHSCLQAHRERRQRGERDLEILRSLSSAKDREVERVREELSANRLRLLPPLEASGGPEQLQAVDAHKGREAAQNQRFGLALQHLHRLESRLVTVSREIEFKESQLGLMHSKLESVRLEVNIVNNTAWTTKTPRNDGFLINTQTLGLSDSPHAKNGAGVFSSGFGISPVGSTSSNPQLTVMDA